MSVAHRKGVIRTGEFIAMYLATAAPCGVAFYLRSLNSRQPRTRRVLLATAAALVWPFAAVVLARSSAGQKHVEGESRHNTRIENAKRSLINSIRRIEDKLEARPQFASQSNRHVFFAAREAVERFVGLTLARMEVDENCPPSARELELCRLAGRSGDDLMIAGYCVHRRNATRLVAHHHRSRIALLEGLTAVRESAIQRSDSEDAETQETISQAVVTSLGYAVELLSLLKDRDSVAAITQVLARECERHQQLSAHATRTPQHDETAIKSAFAAAARKPGLNAEL